MITQIDVRDVLVQMGHGHPDLVTRPTGRAVRSSIETELARLSGRMVVVLDFTAVRIIDCSCADEIVAKLVQASLTMASPYDAFFLIRGLHDDQVREIEEVLRSQRLALVAETNGGLQLIGAVADDARVAFEHLVVRGRAGAEELAAELSWPLDLVRSTLAELADRHLLMQDAGRYHPPTAAA